MYRVIGVFPDEVGNQHVKLIKSSSIGDYQWNSTTGEITWDQSDLYKGLNSSYFYTNTNYDYMQNNTWRNKIENWRWTEARSGTIFRGSSLDFNMKAPINYFSDTFKGGTGILYKEAYLHEMNRETKKTKIGSWNYTNAKIGLMYISDYYLSLPMNDIIGVSSLQSIFGQYLITSWLMYSDSDYSEWTMATRYYQNMQAYMIEPFDDELYIGAEKVTDQYMIRPTFYLTSDVELSSGSGTSTDPYILK